MAILQFRSPVTKPLLRAGTAKPVPPDPRAYETFRVTQTFDSLDGYYKGVKHNAVDIGNFRCGDPVVAMAPGRAWPVQDSAGALGVKINHGNGVWSEYWHLNRRDVTPGMEVIAGQQIGIVGSTGLGSVCHLHVEVKVDGVRIDPEPLMFGGSLTVGEDMKLKGKFLRYITDMKGTLTVNSNFRTGVIAGDDEPWGVVPAGTGFRPFAVVEGRGVGTGAGATEWIVTMQWLSGHGYVFGYYHSSVVELTPDNAAEAKLEEQLEEAAEKLNYAKYHLGKILQGLG